MTWTHEPSHAQPQSTDDDHRWRAVLQRDTAHDGNFVYGVLTTGIYCRPICPSRRPNRKNVRFFSNWHEAEQAGFRACRRCRPGAGTSSSWIAELCAFLDEHYAEPITLGSLAARFRLSPFHLQRSFKAAVGVTPKQYMESRRTQAFKSRLRTGAAVTTATYEAGYGSSSRVYERSDERLGMRPGDYRRGGAGLRISYGYVSSPLGLLMVAATDRGLCFVQFGQSTEDLEAALRLEYPGAELSPMPDPPPSHWTEWMAALADHLDGSRPRVELPLDIRATAFQMQVWRYLQSIPVGGTHSYSEVATAIGRPGSARAVARACASNNVALVIPCHRVIRGSGDLGGYRWGVDRKRALLKRERKNSTA